MKARLKEAMKDALRAREKSRLETVRMLLSAIQYEEIEKGSNDLADDHIIAVLKRELKKRKEELEYATKAGREDLLERINREIDTITGFLPGQLNREQLLTIVKTIVFQEESPSIGIIMKALKDQYGGQYDGKEASEVVKEVLDE